MSLTSAQASSLAKSDTWFRYHMPYSFQRLKDFTGHVWLPVNRQYKPIGKLEKEFATYEDFVANAIKFTRDPNTFEGVWHGKSRGDALYLYDDSPASRVDYFLRLEKLFTYKVRLTPEGKAATGKMFAE